MNLQDIFYVVGIICMTLYTLLLIAIAILLFYIKKKINEVQRMVEERIETIKEVVAHPKQVASSVGAAVADVALTQAEKIIRPKKKRKR